MSPWHDYVVYFIDYRVYCFYQVANMASNKRKIGCVNYVVFEGEPGFDDKNKT